MFQSRKNEEDEKRKDFDKKYEHMKKILFVQNKLNILQLERNLKKNKIISDLQNDKREKDKKYQSQEVKMKEIQKQVTVSNEHLTFLKREKTIAAEKYENEIDQLEKKVKATNDKLSLSEEKVVSAEKAYQDQVDHSRNVLEQSKRQEESLNSRVKGYELKVNQLEKEVKECNDKLTLSEEKLEAYQVQVKSLEDKVEESKREQMRLDSSAKEYEQKVNQLQKMLKERNDKLTLSEEKLESTVTSYELKVDRLQKQLLESNDKLLLSQEKVKESSHQVLSSQESLPTATQAYENRHNPVQDTIQEQQDHQEQDNLEEDNQKLVSTENETSDSINYNPVQDTIQEQQDNKEQEKLEEDNQELVSTENETSVSTNYNPVPVQTMSYAPRVVNSFIPNQERKTVLSSQESLPTATPAYENRHNPVQDNQKLVQTENKTSDLINYNPLPVQTRTYAEVVKSYIPNKERKTVHHTAYSKQPLVSKKKYKKEVTRAQGHSRQVNELVTCDKCRSQGHSGKDCPYVLRKK